MRIFIDETGSFVVPSHGRTSFCCVGALVIPDATYDLFLREFSKISKRWPHKNGEIKGAHLQPEHIFALADLGNRLGLTYFFSGTDMSYMGDIDITFHRAEQAKAMLANLTPEHQPQLVRQVHELSEKLNGMSPQLYIQFVLLTELVSAVIRIMPVYFSITRPRELGAFAWTIDAKDQKKTDYENLWELLCGLIVQSKFREKPPYAINEADNSDFEEAFLNDNQQWPDYMPAPNRSPQSKGGQIYDLRKLLRDSLSFTDSKGSMGLQAVDVITNAMRRSFHGDLSPTIWREMGKLLLAVPMEKFAPLLHINDEMDGERIDAPYAEVLGYFEQVAERKFNDAFRAFREKRDAQQ